MQKKIILIVVMLLLLITLSLYYTYATDVTMEETTGDVDLTYNINITDTSGRTITVEAGKTKYFDIFITNTNATTINYGLAYNNVENENITIAQLDSSKNAASDLIDSNTIYQISLVIKNETESDITYNIAPVVGYTNGGDLIVSSDYTLITDVYSTESNTISGTVSDWIEVNGSGSELGAEGTRDTSGANTPDLVEGLIPVMYSDGTWVKADSTNNSTTYGWYNYDKKKWANAVLVSSTNRDSYTDADVGTEIAEDDILAYYVWIPRYKYKVWNINKEMGTDSYDAQTTGIDIVFENETETTGTITCEYDFSILEGEELSETCSGSNGDYYTHPAFTFGDSEVRGIWVGKYEIASSSPTTSYGGGSSTTLTVRILPGVNSWRYNTISNYYKVIQNMQASSNEYGLTTDTTEADSHMLKNIEWGAVAYLSHSDYGMCSDGKCSEVALNSHYSGSGSSMIVYTGCGPQSSGSTSSGTTCNEYDSELGQLASTTGNVYGIYDMSGGAEEYVMGNMSSEEYWYTYNAVDAGSNYSYLTTTTKYVDTYAYGTSYEDQIAYNRSRLGDATGEVVIGDAFSWNDNYNGFVFSSDSSSDPWFGRGGSYGSGSDAGIFNFYFGAGGSVTYVSARAALLAP